MFNSCGIHSQGVGKLQEFAKLVLAHTKYSTHPSGSQETEEKNQIKNEYFNEFNKKT